MLPESKLFPRSVAVWGTTSSFFQTTVSPALTTSVAGMFFIPRRATVWVLGLYAAAEAPASTGPQQIEMGDDVFKPVQLIVAAGTKVTWVNKGSKAHTVVSNDKLFDSGLVNVGGEFSHTFDARGTYSYHCAPHAKMIGQIVVK